MDTINLLGYYLLLLDLKYCLSKPVTVDAWAAPYLAFFAGLIFVVWMIVTEFGGFLIGENLSPVSIGAFCQDSDV